MCETQHPSPGPTPFELGAAQISAGRRTLLTAGAGIAFSAAAGALEAEAAAARTKRTRKRAYVLVVDGCIPEEIDSGLTPNLRRLRNQGLRFSRAQSMPIMETIPNHVMMMTGLRPDRSGVPANAIYDRKRRTVRDMDRASDIRCDTIIERLNRNGLRTGTVLSKEYLYGVFGARAKRRWEPGPIIPISGHAPDIFTMRAAESMVKNYDPHLMFVNLGDVDRFGHVDLTGSLGLRALRRLALIDTDNLVGGFVDLLKSRGLWEHSMLIVLADHSMDWSRPDRIISVASSLEADPLLKGRVEIADNGGADLLYWTGPKGRRGEAIRRMRKIAQKVPGVLSTHDRRADWLRLGPEAGDVIVYAKQGWRFSDPNPVASNPIPGNHGHPATRPIPFFISGGHRSLPRRKASSKMARTIDVAPTVADFFGIRTRPKGGWDGRSRLAHR